MHVPRQVVGRISGSGKFGDGRVGQAVVATGGGLAGQMSPAHVTAGALAVWFLRGPAPDGPEDPRPGRWNGPSPWACKRVMPLVAMTGRIPRHAGPGPVTGPAQEPRNLGHRTGPLHDPGGNDSFGEPGTAPPAPARSNPCPKHRKHHSSPVPKNMRHSTPCRIWSQRDTMPIGLPGEPQRPGREAIRAPRKAGRNRS